MMAKAKQLIKYDVYGQKKKAEEKFAAWAKGKPEYENIFTEWEKAYDDMAALFKEQDVYE